MDKSSGVIYAIYSQTATELIIACQAYRLTDEYSLIIFTKKKVFIHLIHREMMPRSYQGTPKCTTK